MMRLLDWLFSKKSPVLAEPGMGLLDEPDAGSAPVRAVPPRLLSPAEGAVVQNGDRSTGVALTWEFCWSEVIGADRYHLKVVHESTTVPLVNEWVDGSRYQVVRPGYGVAGTQLKGWTWKVKARVGGRWSGWSERRTFGVEGPAG